MRNPPAPPGNPLIFLLLPSCSSRPATPHSGIRSPANDEYNEGDRTAAWLRTEEPNDVALLLTTPAEPREMMPTEKAEVVGAVVHNPTATEPSTWRYMRVQFLLLERLALTRWIFPGTEAGQFTLACALCGKGLSGGAISRTAPQLSQKDNSTKTIIHIKHQTCWDKLRSTPFSYPSISCTTPLSLSFVVVTP